MAPLLRIDVVGDQQGTTIANIDDEALVSQAIIVIRKNAANHLWPPRFHLAMRYLALSNWHHRDFNSSICLTAC